MESVLHQRKLYHRAIALAAMIIVIVLCVGFAVYRGETVGLGSIESQIDKARCRRISMAIEKQDANFTLQPLKYTKTIYPVADIDHLILPDQNEKSKPSHLSPRLFCKVTPYDLALHFRFYSKMFFSSLIYKSHTLKPHEPPPELV
jgi:hypothetical protein